MRNAEQIIKCINGKRINHKNRGWTANKGLAKKGFTLIELMIAVVIVGVLATIALPMYQNYMEKVHFSEAVSKLGSMRSAMVTYLQTHPYNNDPDHKWMVTLDVSYSGGTVSAHYMYTDIYSNWNGASGFCQSDRTYNDGGTGKLTLSSTNGFDTYGNIPQSPCGSLGEVSLPIPLPRILPHNDQQDLNVTLYQYTTGYQPAVIDPGLHLAMGLATPIRASLTFNAGCKDSDSGVGPSCTSFSKGSTPEVGIYDVLKLDQTFQSNPNQPNNEMKWMRHSDSTCLKWSSGSLC